ncbi:MAG: bifunctional phosphoribosyl-AMP cyclohydrolase/phosphoribosyl-ATP diphosphatase HisIE [Brumimicrobium sp.]|nr:bifunctional phosphoribosyl-AMP cyclohydrolase/phosphoribosyl-ATP diphosphatase HisIE [Brumimicrobium sp.]
MKVDFDKENGLVPAIVQDAFTLEVLMLGYMNEEAYNKTLSTGKVTFFSRSRQKIWTKGEESGNFLNMLSVEVDCDNDTLLIKAEPEGPTCHKGTTTCWGEHSFTGFSTIGKLESVIEDRRNNPNEKSYVSSLVRSGINKVAQKVGEEAVEVVIEALDSDDNLFLNESADLFFHYLILLQEKGYKLKDVLGVLEERNKK